MLPDARYGRCLVASAFTEGDDGAHLIKSVTRAARDFLLVHAGAGGRADPDPVGHQPGRPGHHRRPPDKASCPARQAAPSRFWTIRPAEFAATIRDLTWQRHCRGVRQLGKTTFDASLASLAVRARWRCSAHPGPVPPVDPGGSTPAGSVFLTRPSLAHFTRTADEFNPGVQRGCWMRSPAARSRHRRRAHWPKSRAEDTTICRGRKTTGSGRACEGFALSVRELHVVACGEPTRSGQENSVGRAIAGRSPAPE